MLVIPKITVVFLEMGKIFTSILESRIKIWLHEVGFRHDYSIIDNVFVLQSLCQMYLSKPKHRFYAFDFVDRNQLVYAFLMKCVHGNSFRILKDMYGVSFW